MDNKFESGGGKQVNISQQISGNSNIIAGRDVTVTYGIPPEIFVELAGKLAVTESALASFFKILEQQQVPHSDLDSTLRKIAGQYTELRLRLDTVQSADPQVKLLKEEAGRAIAQGRLADAESLLKAQIHNSFNSDGGQQNIAQGTGAIGQQVNNTYNITQQVPVKELQEMLKLLAEIKAQLPELPQKARGDSATALKYLEQSLRITQEIGNRAGEGAALNNIGQIYYMQGNYVSALCYLEQSLTIHRMLGDKASEVATLNNIAQLYLCTGN